MTNSSEFNVEQLHLQTEVMAHLGRALPGYLPGRRWFADKQRQIMTVEITDLGWFSSGETSIALCITDVSFADGHNALYFTPISVAPYYPETADVIGSLEIEGSQFFVSDAIESPDFQDWLLHSLAAEKVSASSLGTLSFHKEFSDPAFPLALRGRAVKLEQSNSAIFFGDLLIAKIYRRLSSGVNPDIAVGRHLNTISSYVDTPRLYGSAEYKNECDHFTLVMFQQQLDHPVDCWTLLCEMLARQNYSAAEVGHELGALTARMHSAFGTPSSDPAFDSSTATDQTISIWSESFSTAIDHVENILSASLPALDPESADLARTVLGGIPAIRRRREGFRELIGHPVIRVHGDFHLGQILRDTDHRYYVIDFEGEPQRSIQERQARTSPLKDVAGMLRSFAYARGTATAELRSAREEALISWEHRQRSAFITSYLESIRNDQPHILPADGDILNDALIAWEIDKALYEVLYELSSRPTWVWLPLASMAQYV